MENFEAVFISMDKLLRWGGLIIILVAIYIETGLLLGLVIPGGETLLFSAGLLTSTHVLKLDIIVLLVLSTLVAVAGDSTGYYIGRRTGPHIYEWKENWIYKRKYLDQASRFYHKHGKWGLTLGRFLPIIRTFNPLLSGVTSFPYPKFLLFSVIGCLLYVNSIILGGYFLGRQFPIIKNYLEYVFLGIALLVLIPVIRQIIKDNLKKN